MNKSCGVSTINASLMKRCDATHTHTMTQSEISQNPQMQKWLTLLYIQSSPNTHISLTTHMWLALMVLETLLLSTTQKSSHIANISVRFCVCACVADGTHVWSVVAGWLEPEVSEGFFRKGGAAEDNNTNMHIFIHAHTSFPINKLLAFHHRSPPCVPRGG